MVINNNSNENILTELRKISEYINYGIHLTIIKQLGDISIEEETQYAIKILKNFMNGQTNSLTSNNNIRKNMKAIDQFKIVTLLIKSAIDRYAFDTVKLKKLKMESNEDKVVETITESLSEGNLDDILNWITSDSRIMSILIENHVNLCYQSDSQLIEAYAYMTNKDPKSRRAVEQLSYKLSPKTLNQNIL